MDTPFIMLTPFILFHLFPGAVITLIPSPGPDLFEDSCVPQTLRFRPGPALAPPVNSSYTHTHSYRGQPGLPASSFTASMHADGRIEDAYERTYDYSPRESDRENDSGNSSRHQDMQMERSHLGYNEEVLENAPIHDKEVSHFVHSSPHNSGKKASRPPTGMDDDVDDMSSVDSEKSFRASYDNS